MGSSTKSTTGLAKKKAAAATRQVSPVLAASRPAWSRFSREALTSRFARREASETRLMSIAGSPSRCRFILSDRHCVLDRLTCFRFHCASEKRGLLWSASSSRGRKEGFRIGSISDMALRNRRVSLTPGCGLNRVTGLVRGFGVHVRISSSISVKAPPLRKTKLVSFL